MRIGPLVGIGLVACALVPRVARADGAFPDSLSIYAPADRPHEIVVATNFGILVTEDDGKTWQWICEQAIGSYASLYQMGAPPAHAMYTIAGTQLLTSMDTCSWGKAGGSLMNALAHDEFADPNEPGKVFALARLMTNDGSSSPYGAFVSTDYGQTWSDSMYTAPADAVLEGVESSKSDPNTIYLAMYRTQPVRPLLLHSTDGGKNWDAHEHSPYLASNVERILAVDPADPLTVYVRVVGQEVDQFAMTSDGGTTLKYAFSLPAPTVAGANTSMSAFLKQADGTLLVASRDAGAFRSTDGGKTFAPWPTAPHLRGLAERAGSIYAIADNFADNYAVGVSTDGGTTWKPLLRFDGICGVKSCGTIQSTCATPWQALITMFEIPPSVCGGSAGSAGAAGMTGTMVTTGKKSGCVAGAGNTDALAGLIAGVILLALGYIRRRRRTG
jgi:photosystem II stability/assembly factor-like uncharacterized protein